MKNFLSKIGTFIENFLNADKGTQIRTITFFASIVALIAQTVFKKEITFDAETIRYYIIEVAVVVAGIISWWKNNDITPIARQYTEAMRAEKQTVYEEIEEDEYLTENEG